ncbi:hypothetical protein SAG0125_08090 [Streptococcus agalactiae STIR-CD-21]|nr:hypothetical protein SAG0125_08090 [Streptococcus agalactiae STIR-CD-21]
MCLSKFFYHNTIISLFLIFVKYKLKEYGFQPDISMILEVFEIAYGMKWLAEYMSEHPDELR